MPYKKPPLSKEEIDVLTRWIDQGAKWGKHWAYTLPKDVEVPEQQGFMAGFFGAEDKEQKLTPIDHFIVKRQEEHGLNMSPEAERATLLRRLSLDLEGLPPDPSMVDTGSQGVGSGKGVSEG